MTWRDELQTASFRGVEFRVSRHSLDGGGRRIVTHEFPVRDTPFSEDMGRNTKEFSIEAFIVSEDYFAARNALMRACDTAGPGELVHPYLGSLAVYCKGYQLQETADEGRIASFTLSFVESGAALEPDTAVDAASVTATQAETSRSVAGSSFESVFDASDLPQFAKDDAAAIFTEATNILAVISRSLSVSAAADALGIGSFVTGLTSLISQAGQLASQFLALPKAISDYISNPIGAVKGFALLFGFGSSDTPVSETTLTRQRQADNRKAIYILVRHAAVIEAAVHHSLAVYVTQDDLIANRDLILAEIDSIELDLPIDDDTFVSLGKLRTAVVTASNVKVNLPLLSAYSPPQIMSALQVAYDLYGDASRDLEIVDRNLPSYPGFLSPGVAYYIIAGGEDA